MGRCSIQIVMGPAGSGKSTYCSTMQQHCLTKRSGAASHSAAKHAIPIIHVANLDPAAEYFTYEPIFDIRDVISVDEVMEELSLGPNGALLYCMEYILDHHLSWLHDEIEAMGDDDYLFLDCPGQIELYTHIPIQKRILDTIRMWGYEGNMVSVFCIDATFCCSDSYKLLSGNLLSLSTMIALELPHVTLLTKCDLISNKALERILSDYTSASYVHQLDQNQQSLLFLNENVTEIRNENRGAAVDNNNNNNDTNHVQSSMTVELRERRRRHQQQQIHRADGDADDEIITQEDIDAAKEVTAAAATTPAVDAGKNHGNAARGNTRTNIKKDHSGINGNTTSHMEYLQQLEHRRLQRHKLTLAISQIVDDYSMVGYLPLNIYDEDSCDHVLYTVSQCIQYGEDHDVYTGGDDNDDNNDYEPPDNTE
jgi:GPN-loop GTPase